MRGRWTRDLHHGFLCVRLSRAATASWVRTLGSPVLDSWILRSENTMCRYARFSELFLFVFAGFGRRRIITHTCQFHNQIQIRPQKTTLTPKISPIFLAETIGPKIGYFLTSKTKTQSSVCAQIRKAPRCSFLGGKKGSS